jgi:hypothetical protein
MQNTTYISESKGADWKGCLMLSMPYDVGAMIAAWSERNIPREALADNGRETYAHCTILYGFPQHVAFEEVESFLNYEYGLTSETKVLISLGKIKRFTGNPEYDVLVIEVEQGMLIRQMHYGLKDKFNVKTDYPTYNPHVTIAYVKPGALPHLDGNATFEGFDANCEKMTYSTGPREDRKVATVKYDNGSKEKDS